VITLGGTYSGTWTSKDPGIPALTIATSDPVEIINSTISGSGTLISATIAGSRLTLRNVTGTGLDAGVAGGHLGSFLFADSIASLSVSNCTMSHVEFGILVRNSTLTALSILRNTATDLEDRASDGQGGFKLVDRVAGHFIQLVDVKAENGGVIAWNQVVNVPGISSVEDMIDMYDSHGTADANILINDNYLQGAFSTGSSSYSGGGIMTEGASSDLETMTGYIDIERNSVVQTANYGIAIATGHDVKEDNNRVISCGKDQAGNWLAGVSATAMYMWNITKSLEYYNNEIMGNTGGLVRPDAKGNPMIANLWAPSVSEALADVAANNVFSNPCWTNGKVTSTAEADEAVAWQKKLVEAGMIIGDQHN